MVQSLELNTPKSDNQSNWFILPVLPIDQRRQLKNLESKNYLDPKNLTCYNYPSTMTKINAIIFDLNEIFIKSVPFSQRVEEKFGINRDLFYREFEKYLKIARVNNDRDSSFWQPIADLLKISVASFLDFWFSGESVDQQMFAFAKELKNSGYKIFILSNNLQERTQYYRQHFSELLNIFDDLYFSWETGFTKPDPKAFQNILDQHHLLPQNCIYFDDSQTNVQTAISLGIHSRVFEDLISTQKFIEENKS
jgi:putative hydrolase of the HAD superfamily